MSMSSGRRPFRALVMRPFLAATLFLAVGPAGAASRPNILVVCINCANKSHLGVYGYRRTTTPRIDQFAERAYVFTNLVSPTTWTPPALFELMNLRESDPGLDRAPPKDSAPFADTAVQKHLASLGYAEVRVDLLWRKPPSEPFFCFWHPTFLHGPYDPRLARENELTGREKAFYRAALRAALHYEFVRGTERPTSDFSLFAFGRDSNALPEGDVTIWNEILAAAGDSAAGPRRDLLRWALDARTFRALSEPGRSGGLSRREKQAVVKALNRLVGAGDTPLTPLLLSAARAWKARASAPGFAFYSLDGIFVSMARLGKTVTDAEALPVSPGHDRASRLRRRLLYCALLDGFFPALDPEKGAAFSPLAARQRVTRAGAGDAASPSDAMEQAILEKLYDANLRDLDALFGSLLDSLRATGALDRTLVVLMGDHGEALREHGRRGHAHIGPFDELLIPPLIIRPPDPPPERTVVAAQLRTMDVFPTVLDLAGLPPVPGDDGPVEGVSFRPAPAGSAPAVTAFSRNGLDTWSVRTPDGWKLIWNRTDDWVKLFDLRADPGETRDLAENFPERTATLQGQLQDHILRPRPR
jgi:hypothetical protein